MKTLLNAMVISFAMYSKIPMPRVEWSKENMKYSMCFFPAVGMVIGALVTAWGLVGARAVMSPAFYTAVMILIPVFVTGGLHLDGLLDTADAMSSYQSRERRLEILKDSNSGAFAVITCVCYFILDYGVWTEVKGEALLVLSLGFVLCGAGTEKDGTGGDGGSYRGGGPADVSDFRAAGGGGSGGGGLCVRILPLYVLHPFRRHYRGSGRLFFAGV